MLLAKLLQNQQKYGRIPFSLVFLAMDPGYAPEVRRHIEENAERLELPVEFFHTNVLRVAANHAAEHPCFLCAKMRRGHLYTQAQARGCNKIALGHHYDDAIETALHAVREEAREEAVRRGARGEILVTAEAVPITATVGQEAVNSHELYLSTRVTASASGSAGF